MNWYYKNKIVDENSVPKGAIGFIYAIYKFESERHARDKFLISPDYEKLYIGKKQLSMSTKKKIGVRAQAKQLLETGDKRKVKKVIRGSKVSNWMQYNSSCAPLVKEIKETPELFRKEIIQFCYSKKELTFCEIEQQIFHNVLRTDSFNDNILGKFYKKDLTKPVK